MLVTNPPYSGDHKERVIEFCLDSGKPWALLLPNYVATKQYYTAAVAKHSVHHGRIGGGGGGGKQQPFYIVPQPGLQYQYTHPEGTGHRCGWEVCYCWMLEPDCYIHNCCSSVSKLLRIS